MRSSNAKAIACKISRGGFSDERVFAFTAFGGKEYSGVASRIHMWNSEGKPLEEGEPPVGQIIDGLVAARILQAVNEDEILVSVPDGGVVSVPSGDLMERPVGVGQHVSI